MVNGEFGTATFSDGWWWIDNNNGERFRTRYADVMRDAVHKNLYGRFRERTEMVKYVVFKMDLTQDDIDAIIPSGSVNVDIFAERGNVSTDNSEIILMASDKATIVDLL